MKSYNQSTLKREAYANEIQTLLGYYLTIIFKMRIKKNIIIQRIQTNHIYCELQSLKDSDMALKVSNFLRVRGENFKVMLVEMSIGIAELQ